MTKPELKKSVTVKRGPLAGMEVTLVGRHLAAAAWMANVDDEHPLVMVWDWELVETVERKPKTKKGR